MIFLIIYLTLSLLGILTINNTFKVKYSSRVNKTIDYRSVICGFYCVAMSLIVGLRCETVGTDTLTYIESFESDFELERLVRFEYKYEIGYRYFVKAVRVITSNEHVFLLIIAGLTFYGFFRFIKNTCEDEAIIPLLGIISFLFYSSLSAVRQNLAIAIVINSIAYMKDRKWLKAIFLIGIAASIHTISLVVVIFIPFALAKWDKKKVMISIFASVGGIVLSDRIIAIALRYFPAYGRYIDNGYLDSSGNGIGTFSIVCILIIVLSIIILYSGNADSLTEKEMGDYILSIIGTVFAVGTDIISNQYALLSRLTRYFIPFMILHVTILYSKCLKKYKAISYFAIVAIFGAFLWITVHNDLYNVIPYSTFWED